MEWSTQLIDFVLSGAGPVTDETKSCIIGYNSNLPARTAAKAAIIGYNYKTTLQKPPRF